MLPESDFVVSRGSDTAIQANIDKATSNKDLSKKKENLYAVIFLSAVTGISAVIGFGSTLAAAKKQDPKFFAEGISGSKSFAESGASLALRALGWGTVYAVTGCGILFYGIWKLSGATNAKEFRLKMGSILPRIPKNNQEKVEDIKNLTDLLTYISEDWDKKQVRNE